MFTNRKITVLVVLALATVFALGLWNALAQDDTNSSCDFAQMYGMNGRGMGSGMMTDLPEGCLQSGIYGMGMMGGMMGQFGGMGMVMGFDSETMGRFGPGNGMMGAWTPPPDLNPTSDALSIDEAVEIAEAYIAEWETNTPLELGEVMQFDNHFYGNAIESDSNQGAFEFLIDPQTGIVYGEPGPNMMWNLEYGMSMGRGMGMYHPSPGNTELRIDTEEAINLAQVFLDEVMADAIADETDVTIFPGYYTLHILEDDVIIGMLSVNGYSGQVWLHHWHGEYIDMTEH